MGANICKGKSAGLCVVDSKEYVWKRDESLAMPLKEPFEKHVSPVYLPPPHSRSVAADPVGGKMNMMQHEMSFFPTRSKTKRKVFSNSKSAFETKLPSFVNASMSRTHNNGLISDQTFEAVSTKSVDNNDDGFHRDWPSSEPACSAGGEACSLSLSVVLNETQGRGGLQCSPRQVGTIRPRFCRWRSAVDFPFSASQTASARGGGCGSVASDVSSFSDSVANSVKSDCSIVRILRPANDNTKTLENAKATLLKHFNMSNMSSLRSGEFSRCSSMGYYPSNENDLSFGKGAKALGCCSPSIAHLSNTGQVGEGVFECESFCENTPFRPHPPNRTLSFCSVCLSSTATTKNYDTLSKCGLSFVDLMDNSSTSVLCRTHPGGAQEAVGGPAQRPRHVHTMKAGRRLCGMVLVSPDTAGGLKKTFPNRGACERCRDSSGVEKANSTSTRWVAIGAESGVGSESWYARLRERCEMEDLDEVS